MRPDLSNTRLKFYIEGNHIFDATINQKGYTIIKKNSNIGKKIMEAVEKNYEIYAQLFD